MDEPLSVFSGVVALAAVVFLFPLWDFVPPQVCVVRVEEVGEEGGGGGGGAATQPAQVAHPTPIEVLRTTTNSTTSHPGLGQRTLLLEYAARGATI